LAKYFQSRYIKKIYPTIFDLVITLLRRLNKIIYLPYIAAGLVDRKYHVSHSIFSSIARKDNLKRDSECSLEIFLETKLQFGEKLKESES
jgi:hypothetical protein